MKFYQRLEEFSQGIYKLFIKFEGLTANEYELCNELLRDLYLEEENFLGNMKDHDFEKLIKYMKETFGFTFEQTIYELGVKNTYDVFTLRIYQRVKEEKDRREFTSLTIKEINSFLSNPFVNEMKKAYETVKNLDILLLTNLSAKQKSTYMYLLSSFSYPISPSFASLQNIKKQSLFSVEVSFATSGFLIKKYLYSLLKTYLKTSNENYLILLARYVSLLPEQDIQYLFEYFENNYAKEREQLQASKHSLYMVNQLWKKLNFGEINFNINDPIDIDDELYYKEFTANKIHYYTNFYQEIQAFSGAMFKLFCKIYESKCNRENKESRTKFYIQLARLRQVERETIQSVSNISEFQKFMKLLCDHSYLTVPFDILDCAKNILKKDGFQDQVWIEKIMKNRTLNSILLEKDQKRSFEENEVVGFTTIVEINPNATIGSVLENLMATNNNALTLEEYVDGVLYQIDNMFYNLLKSKENTEINSKNYLAMFLLLYRDPSVLETLITKDFELQYRIEEAPVTKDLACITILLEYVYGMMDDALMREDEESFELFKEMLSCFNHFLPKESCDAILLDFENKRNLKKGPKK